MLAWMKSRNRVDPNRLMIDFLVLAAVPLAKAHELWGWGTKAEAAAPQAAAPRVLVKNQAPEWTDERLATRRDALKGRDPMQKLIAEVLRSSGVTLSDGEIRRRIRRWKASAKETPAPRSLEAVWGAGENRRRA
jgi:hypothetical protein